MNRNFQLLFFFLLSFTLPAQDEDAKGNTKFCSDDISKKAMAFYEKGIDKKKHKKPERLEFLMKAIELENDFAEAHLAMGLELAARCKLENKPFDPTLPFFYKAIASCPKIHSEPYYYIGYSYYEK
jgi:hypothetical protein